MRISRVSRKRRGRLLTVATMHTQSSCHHLKYLMYIRVKMDKTKYIPARRVVIQRIPAWSNSEMGENLWLSVVFDDMADMKVRIATGDYGDKGEMEGLRKCRHCAEKLIWM